MHSRIEINFGLAPHYIFFKILATISMISSKVNNLVKLVSNQLIIVFWNIIKFNPRFRM